ncbi:p53 negative regulator [Parasponia andersonii]|uniref:p53 negative regulator n=1 Tax=Parasponia andersonii TaxID=3476 RepID=A0A2P5A943_PARAD|nr:p53 negative regulator [Parasponia andersonii]
MVSDQEIAKGVETLLRQSEPNAFTSVNGVVQQLEAKLGLDLSHKAVFIRDQINLLLRSHPQQQPQHQHQRQYQQQHHHLPKDHVALHSHPTQTQAQAQYPTALRPHPQPQPQQFSPHFALHPYHHNHHRPIDAHTFQPPSAPPPHVHPPAKPELFAHNVSTVPSEMPKESAPVGTKRRGGPGGLNKVCGVSPELQAIVGEPAMPRTEIVKQLWAYIRKNNLQDPSNKRKIICDDALRVVFETDCTDMFKMNKLLAKHIIALEPTKGASQAKRVKVDIESTPESTDTASSCVIISEPLAKFLDTGGREMQRSEALSRVWEYIKVNHLEDPLNSMAILCDAKLRELLGCESISALGISEMLERHHLFQRS